MRIVSAIALVAITFFAVPTASADQCAYVDRATAERAAEILRRSSQVVSFCEPCLEAAPGEPRGVRTVGFREVDEGFAEVSLDGAGIDLAYTYVLDSAHPGEYQNLAMLAGCSTQGISAVLRVSDATETGVLITPDPHATVVAALSPAPAPTTPCPAFVTASSPPALPAPPAPPVIYIYQAGVPLWVLALCMASAMLVMVAAALWIFRARRGGSLPKAISLRG